MPCGGVSIYILHLIFEICFLSLIRLGYKVGNNITLTVCNFIAYFHFV